MKTTDYTLVINLSSRQSEKALANIKKAFRASKSSLSVIAVKDPKKLNDAFAKAIKKNPGVIILGGGDGTLISGIEYLSNADYKKPIGLLPLGTANYLARNLSLPLSIEDSIAILLKGKSREIPIGIANKKFFALIFVIGLTQAVSDNISDTFKRRFGQIAYVIELVKQTKNHTAFRYTIDSPSLKKPLKGTSHQILVYNSDLNQQLKLVPDHALRKPTLKIIVSRTGHSISKLYLGFLIHVLSFGKFRPFMRVFEAQKLTIETDPRLPADYDGEVAGKSPFEITMCKKKIRVIC